MKAALKAIAKLGWTDRSESDIRIIETIDELKQAVHRYGVVMIAMKIHHQWKSQIGKYEMNSISGDLLGGHAVLCCGYDRHGVIIQNSWSQDWGKFGYCNIAWSVFCEEFIEGAYYANILNCLEEE